MSDSSAVRVLRRQAERRGLSLIKREDLFLLVDRNAVVVAAGEFGDIRRALPPCRPGPRPLAVPEGWDPVIDEWCRHMTAAGIRPASRDTWQRVVNRIARALPASTPADVTASMLVEFFAANAHWRPDTRGIYLTSARKFFRWCHRHGHVDWFLTDEDLPARPKAEPLARPVPDAVWRDAFARAPRRVQVMMRLAAEAGLRRAEVAGVHTDHLIDGPGGAELVVYGKGGKTRRIPLTDSLGAVIRAGARGHTPDMPATGWLFPSRWDHGKPLTPAHVGGIVAEALPAGWSMHKLRHRFATRAFRGSRNIRAVQELLGHASVATTQRYTATDADELRTAMEAAR